MNLRRVIACGRLPGYHLVVNQMPVDLYARKVLWGDITDPVLNFQLRDGVRCCGNMKNYIADDHESKRYASLIVWLNPDYDASRPSGRQLAQTASKEMRP